MKYLKGCYKTGSWFLAFFLAVYPFLTYFYVRKPKGEELVFFAGKSKYIIDLFYGRKEAVLFLTGAFTLAALAFGLIFYWLLKEEPPKRFLLEKKTGLLLGGYFFLTLVSCLVSEYRAYGFLGLALDYEGLAAMLGYLGLFFGGYLLFSQEEGERRLRMGIELLGILLLLGTLTECFVGPFFNIDWVRRALTPERYWNLLDRVEVDYGESVSLTFGNPGFYGGFCALLFGVFSGEGIREEKRLLPKILAGGMLFGTFVSGSTGALYAALLVLAVQIFFAFWKRRWKGLAKTGLWGGTGLLFLCVLVSFSPLFSGKGILKRAAGSVVNEQYQKGEDLFEVEKIELLEGDLYIEGERDRLRVKAPAVFDGGLRCEELEIFDGEGKRLSLEKRGEGKILKGQDGEIRFFALGDVLSLDFGYQDPVEFYAYEGKLYYVDFKGKLLEKIPQPRLEGLEALYPLFTGRGYIWVSSLPVLGKSLILGKGVGSFPFVYPQSEAAGMLNVHGSDDYCIEQAHSWYVQTWINGGLLSLLCLLGLLGLCLFRGFRYFIRENAGPGSMLEPALWGILAYSMAGLVNNSCVACAPMFWILLGFALGRLKNRGQERNSALQ